jgi:hypothetical protein
MAFWLFNNNIEEKFNRACCEAAEAMYKAVETEKEDEFLDNLEKYLNQAEKAHKLDPSRFSEVFNPLHALPVYATFFSKRVSSVEDVYKLANEQQHKDNYNSILERCRQLCLGEEPKTLIENMLLAKIYDGDKILASINNDLDNDEKNGFFDIDKFEIALNVYKSIRDFFVEYRKYDNNYSRQFESVKDLKHHIFGFVSAIINNLNSNQSHIGLYLKVKDIAGVIYNEQEYKNVFGSLDKKVLESEYNKFRNAFTDEKDIAEKLYSGSVEYQVETILSDRMNELYTDVRHIMFSLLKKGNFTKEEKSEYVKKFREVSKNYMSLAKKYKEKIEKLQDNYYFAAEEAKQGSDSADEHINKYLYFSKNYKWMLDEDDDSIYDSIYNL